MKILLDLLLYVASCHTLARALAADEQFAREVFWLSMAWLAVCALAAIALGGVLWATFGALWRRSAKRPAAAPTAV